MSFSSEVKDELSRQLSQARHCQIAEAAAIISLCGRILISSEDRYCIKIHTENRSLDDIADSIIRIRREEVT